MPHYVPISAHHGWGFDDLLEKIWQYAGMVRIYTKPRGQIADFNEPVILHRECQPAPCWRMPSPPCWQTGGRAGASPSHAHAVTPATPCRAAPRCSDEGRNVEDFCNRIHRGLLRQFKYAWVWGSSVKHQPQRVGKDHVLEDEDVVQLVKRN